MAVQHFKMATERNMSITSQMVNLAITTIHDEAPTTRDKWLTLEAWKTILYHYYDLDDELGFSMNILTRAVKLFGSIVDSKVSTGNSTGVHLRTHYFIKYDKDGKKSGTDRVRFLLLADSKEREPKEPTDFSGWIREQKKSNAVVGKTSPLFLGVRALPSFKYRATSPGSLNGADYKISELRKPIKKAPQVVSPIQDAVANNVAAPTTPAASTVNQDPPSQDAIANNVAAPTTAAASTANQDPPSQDAIASNVAAPTTAAASTVNQDPPSQEAPPTHR